MVAKGLIYSNINILNHGEGGREGGEGGDLDAEGGGVGGIGGAKCVGEERV